MTKCTASVLEFPRCQGRRVQAEFSGGAITSDGGVVLLRQVDQRIGLTARLAQALPDPRDPARCEHRLRDLLRQRIYGLALGYEDLNDHQSLRQDLAVQTAVDRDSPLASPATLCRWENRASRAVAWTLHEVLVEQFIASFSQPPEELILDFDATDDPVHGHQEQRFFHGYYDHYCFLPLYVFCGEQLLVSYLRPSNIDGAQHAWAILALLVKRLRQVWPSVRIILRADSGFCRWRMLRWCERHQVDYLIGFAQNRRLNALAQPRLAHAEQLYQTSQCKQRLFSDVQYAAQTWDRPRRVIIKAEHGPKGSNPRYVVTNLLGKSHVLYRERYCARGDMENRIKEQQLDLFADRTSCHAWWPNQFRLLLSSCAYVLVTALQRLGLGGTALATAYVGTLRLKLFKIGAVVLRNTRRIRLLFASHYPYKDLFLTLVARLCPG
jgi:hypothetical protein